MLKLRVLTALALVPLVVWSIYGASTQIFALAFACVFLVGAWEWGYISRIGKPMAHVFYVVLLALMLGSLWYIANDMQFSVVPAILMIVFAFWLLAIISIVRFKGSLASAPTVRLLLFLLAGIFVLCGSYYALLVLRENTEFGPNYVMFVFILIWVADTGAYFSGRQWGRHKLAPVVSPGKSWEGVVGALGCTLLIGWAGGVYFDVAKSQLLPFIIVCLITVMFSIVGDLFESLVKRSGGVKDSGNILPGHGGVMDRIDSLTAAAPVFLLSVWVTGNLW